MHVPVLIVGGGPAGLCASILLSRHGVRSLLVERRRDVLAHPRARSINARSAEIFRGFGLFERLRELSLPPEWTREIIYTRTLAGRELGRVGTGGFDSANTGISPTAPLMSTQDRLEPLLRERARAEEHADVRFGVRLDCFEVTDGKVDATIVNDDAGLAEDVRADYLVAADGAASPIRDHLGITLDGHLGLASVIDVYFRADLARWVAERPAPLYWVAAGEVNGVFQPLDGKREWRCQIAYDADRDVPDDFTSQRCTDWIRAAVGTRSLDIDILSVRPWTMHSAVAARLRHGPVFLAGDAAHILPPTGGFGMNTGVQGVHNLAWKLAGVVRGWADASLLDTYEEERAPVATYNAQRSLENSIAVVQINQAAREGGDVAGSLASARRYGNFIGMDLGFAYDSHAIVADGSAAPEVADPVAEYVPTARPGHRAPHVVLERSGTQLSTLDLFDRQFTLLAGPRGTRWTDAAASAGAAAGVPLQAFRIGAGGDLGDPTGGWLELYGLQPDGAVLVRPDGHVAWRSATGDARPRDVMARVLAQITGRSS